MTRAKMGHDEHDLEPKVAIRRHTDRCFHRVEEVVKGKHGGYIVQGVLICEDDVAEVVELDGGGKPLPGCRVKIAKRG
jgi:hypothetical protein